MLLRTHVIDFYTPCILCTEVVREGSRGFAAVEPYSDMSAQYCPPYPHFSLQHTAAHIGLASDAFHIDEGEGLQRFPISRSGSVNGVNKILCKLKPIDATAQITDQERADFVVPRTPETVTFQPFNTTECMCVSSSIHCQCHVYSSVCE